MSRKTTPLTDELYDYLLDTSLRESDLLRRLREETGRLEQSNMQISPEQGQFMGLLVELLDVRTALEVGTFTGYSALTVTTAMPSDGRLVACDVSEEWTDIAKRYWAEAGVDHMIDLHLAPALETLDALLAQGRGEGFDFVFLDADKTNLGAYYERALSLVRSGGVIAVDNTLWHGKVADPTEDDPATESMRAFNRAVGVDERVSMSLVPIGDGLTLARRR